MGNDRMVLMPTSCIPMAIGRRERGGAGKCKMENGKCKMENGELRIEYGKSISEVKRF